MSHYDHPAQFFTPAAKKTAIEKALLQALEYVEAHGAQKFAEATAASSGRLVAVCGFALEESEPNTPTLIAARLVMQELARGLYRYGIEDEYECLDWDYAEVVETLEGYIVTTDPAPSNASDLEARMDQRFGGKTCPGSVTRRRRSLRNYGKLK
ncbi:MAG: hypothetical protein IT547_07070, partial [Hyphomonadaceae bacterium]|nr:hypothetical protein [Hyphomonadaceae bacterium]